MINTSSRLISLLLFTASFSFAQDQMAYGLHLLESGDYFRANSEFLEQRFKTNNRALQELANLCLAAGYLFSGQEDLGINTLENVESDSELKNLLMGVSQIQNRDIPSGELALSTLLESRNVPGNLARSYLIAFYLSAGQINTVEDLLESTDLLDYGIDSQLLVQEMEREVSSPVIAGILSTLIPGTGQMYSGHWFDGFQALGFNLFFGFSTYGTFLYDSQFSEHYLLTGISATVTALFYLSNILGAVETAGFKNENHRNSILGTFERRLWDGFRAYVLSRLKSQYIQLETE